MSNLGFMDFSNMLPAVRGLNDPETDSDDEPHSVPSPTPARLSTEKIAVYAKTTDDIKVFDGDETYSVTQGTRLRCLIPDSGASDLQNDLPVSFVSNSSTCEITKGYITPQDFRTLADFSL